MSHQSLIDKLLADLQSADHDRRIEALRLLRDHRDPRIAPLLIPLLRDPDAGVRRLAAQGLGDQGDSAAVSPLTDALYDEDAQVRTAAADALGELGNSTAVPCLIDVLYDEAMGVRLAAVEALGSLGDQRAVVDLIHLLDNEGDPLAATAAAALKKIGTPEALAAIQHLYDADELIDLIPRATPAPSAPAPRESEETTRSIPPGVFEHLFDEVEGEAPAPSVAVPVPAPQPEPPGRRRETRSASAVTDVRFSAYYPREIAPEVWKPLRAYVFRAHVANAVAADAARELGDRIDDFREVTRPASGAISEGALITATPELPGFQFNPPSAQVAFYEDWHRFDFKLRAHAAAPDQASNGRITFAVEGVIIADVPLSVYVGTGSRAEATVTASRPVYRAIFCSYSHRDTHIVERVERAYKALGLDFLRDVVTLKSGQDWSEELLNMIERADIFQLFWSDAAAQSKYVRQEWEYALDLKRQDDGFIRPVYWAQPMPPVPPELSSIHFAYAPTLDDPV